MDPISFATIIPLPNLIPMAKALFAQGRKGKEGEIGVRSFALHPNFTTSS
jgi:hypothetical protein